MEDLDNSVSLLFKEIQNYLFEQEDLEKKTIKELIYFQFNLENLTAKLKEGKALIENQLTRIKKDVLPEKMDEEGIKSINIQGIGAVRVQGDVYANIKSDKKEEAFEWLCDNGHSGLVNKSVNGNSFAALARKYHKEGEEMPEELFSITPYSKTIITKSKD